jgi:hypothetical protein
MRRCSLAALFALSLTTCSDDPPPAQSDTVEEDADGDIDRGFEEVSDLAVETTDVSNEEPEPLVNPFPEIPRTEADPDVDPDGAEDVVGELDEGEVRLGIVTSWNTTFAGQETDCRPNDYKIYNALVQFCISGYTPISQLTFTGGHLIDADMVGAGNDRFFANAIQNHLLIASAHEIEVIADGSDGVAVLSVRGPEEPLGLLANVVGNITPYRGVSFETEYRLYPDVTYLEIVTWVRADNSSSGLSSGDLGLLGDTTLPFYPTTGRTTPARNSRFAWMAATAPGRSYAYYTPGGLRLIDLDLSGVANGFPLATLMSATGVVPHEEEGAYRRYFLVGNGGTAEFIETMAEIGELEVPENSATFEVTLGDEGVPGVSLLVLDDEGSFLHIAITDDEGEAEILLEPGSYEVVPEDWVGGEVRAEVFSIDGDDLTVEIALPEPVRLELTITAIELGEEEEAPSQAKVVMIGPRSELIFTHDGVISRDIQPGTYDIVVSRGEEFTAAVFEGVLFEAGEPVVIEALLERVWDTEGLISGEFHQHSTRSPDSQVTEIVRLLSNIVEGVDFVVPSDHEAITDYAPYIALLEAEELIYAMPSTEISPTFTHFNPMPMVFDPALPVGGGFRIAVLQDDGVVRRKSFPEMVAELRALDVPVIQVNHPRGGAALFSYADYEPLSGPEGAISTRFTTDFDSVEVFNSRGSFCEVFQDWLSLVARGYNITGIGNSDTHRLSTEAGYPRNYMPSSAAHPGEITDDDILDGVLNGNVSVSGGALITYPFGPDLGSTVVAEDETYRLRVRIQTPVWSTIDTVYVVEGGSIVETIDVRAAVEEVVAFDRDIEVTLPDRDTYFVIVATGETRMPMVNTGEQPFGFTNPIFLDVDGDGGWTFPDVNGEDDLVRLPISWCNSF